MDERETFLRGLVGVMDDRSVAILKRLLDERLNSPDPATGLLPEERDMCLRGDKIGAIRRLRERLGLDIRTAKDMVDRVVPPGRHPSWGTY